MLAPPTVPLSEMTKHILVGDSRSMHVFTFLASVATTPENSGNTYTVRDVNACICASNRNTVCASNRTVFLLDAQHFSSTWQRIIISEISAVNQTYAKSA